MTISEVDACVREFAKVVDGTTDSNGTDVIKLRYNKSDTNIGLRVEYYLTITLEESYFQDNYQLSLLGGVSVKVEPLDNFALSFKETVVVFKWDDPPVVFHHDVRTKPMVRRHLFDNVTTALLEYSFENEKVFLDHGGSIRLPHDRKKKRRTKPSYRKNQDASYVDRVVQDCLTTYGRYVGDHEYREDEKSQEITFKRDYEEYEVFYAVHVSYDTFFKESKAAFGVTTATGYQKLVETKFEFSAIAINTLDNEKKEYKRVVEETTTIENHCFTNVVLKNVLELPILEANVREDVVKASRLYDLE